ncbi:MAG: hypothetical protein OQK69_08700 [Gammaproteobacteria bacterium]|nr:hypothetical protein [Gammaproteobacteria bacterium]
MSQLLNNIKCFTAETQSNCLNVVGSGVFFPAQRLFVEQEYLPACVVVNICSTVTVCN